MSKKTALLYAFNLASAFMLATQLASPALRLTADTPRAYAENNGFTVSSHDSEIFEAIADTRIIEHGSANETVMLCLDDYKNCGDADGFTAGFLQSPSYFRKIGRPDLITMMPRDTAADAWSIGAAEKKIERQIDTPSVHEFIFRHEVSHAYHVAIKDKNYLSMTKGGQELTADIEAVEGMPATKRVAIGRLVFSLRAINLLDQTHDISLEWEDRLSGRRVQYNPVLKEQSAQLVRNWALECVRKWDEKKRAILPLADLFAQCHGDISVPADDEIYALIDRRFKNFIAAYDYLYRPSPIS